MKVLKFINPLLALSFLTAVTGIILYRWGWEAVMGSFLAYNLHQYAGTAFIILAVCHIILNRKWIKNTYFRKKK
jgi:membrane protein implicated in regulation of membrane protease activity